MTSLPKVHLHDGNYDVIADGQKLLLSVEAPVQKQRSSQITGLVLVYKDTGQ